MSRTRQATSGLRHGLPPQVLVPLQIGARCADARDVRPAVPFRSATAQAARPSLPGPGCASTTACRPHPRRNRCTRCALAAVTRRSLHRDRRHSGRRSGWCGRPQRTVDHNALPGGAAAAVDRHLIAVPGLNGRQKSLLAQLSDGNVAGSGFRPRRRVALAISCGSTGRPPQLEQMICLRNRR